MIELGEEVPTWTTNARLVSFYRFRWPLDSFLLMTGPQLTNSGTSTNAIFVTFYKFRWSLNLFLLMIYTQLADGGIRGGGSNMDKCNIGIVS